MRRIAKEPSVDSISPTVLLEFRIVHKKMAFAQDFDYHDCIYNIYVFVLVYLGSKKA